MERIISADGRFFVVIEPYEYADNPRECYDYATTIVYHSNHYLLGDKDIDPADFTLPDNVWAFRVYAYIHGGIDLSLDEAMFRGMDPQVWDSGQSGIMYIPKDRVSGKAEAYRICHYELKEFAAWLNGDVYGYTIYMAPDDADAATVDVDECKQLDSCWGFYGFDSIQSEVDSVLKDYESTVPMQLSLL